MVASRQSQPLLSSEDTGAVIGSRIKEKRLFEARFLCRKLGRGLTAEQRASLEQQLEASLKQVDQLRNEAKGLLARGEYGPARELYSRLEAIAIDVPGVIEETKALAGAEALAARLSKPAEEVVEEAAPVGPQEEALSSAPKVERPPAQEAISSIPGSIQQKKISPRLWWLAGLAGLLLCILVALILYAGNGAKPKPPMPVAASPKEVASTPQPSTEATVQPDPVTTTPPVEAAKEVQKKPASTPSRPAMNLGGLQIE
ncbi:MAG: hypothetical protein AB7U29_08645 [Desulfobulbus sp.]